MKFIFASIALIASVVAADADFAQWSQSCNPSIFQSLPCAPDLRCVTPPRLLGATGYCAKEVDLGQQCGGSIRFPDVCRSGLTCYNPHAPGMVGTFGTCHPLAREGESCGGTVRYPRVCEQGCECTQPPRGLMGGHGYCVRTPVDPDTAIVA